MFSWALGLLAIMFLSYLVVDSIVFLVCWLGYKLLLEPHGKDEENVKL